MPRVVITGANGFIGRELVAVLQAQGFEIVALSQSGGDGVRRWALGEPLPEDCVGSDAIMHVASAALNSDLKDAVQRDLDGTKILIEQARAWRRSQRFGRFIFLSSQSARANAANSYGRSKWEIEKLLDQPDEIIVRPGLVYSDRPSSVFATFDKLTQMPLVPVVSSRKSVQPIHVRELAECLAQLVSMPTVPRIIQVGAVEPLSFKEAVQATARRAGRRPPLMLPVPMVAVRPVARLLDYVLSLSLTERLDGLGSLEPIDTKPSLELLGKTLEPFDRASRE